MLCGSRRWWRGRSTSSRTRIAGTSISSSTQGRGSSTPSGRVSRRAVAPNSTRAQKSLREAVNGLTESAGTILGPDASTTTLTRVAETLRTAATAPSARELLARGRLTQEMSETGWDIVATFPQPTRRAPKPKPKSDGEPAAPSRAAELADHAQRLQSVEKSYAAARKRQDGARKKERAAAEHLAELQAARAAADEELELLENEIASAEQRLAELRGEDG